MNKLIQFIVEKLGGKLISQALTLFAGFLVQHGLLTGTAKTDWVSTNAGVLLAGVNALIIWFQHRSHTVALNAASSSSPTNPPKPGVGMGNTNIGSNVGLILMAFLLSASLASAQTAFTNSATVTEDLLHVLLNPSTNAVAAPLVNVTVTPGLANAVGLMDTLQALGATTTIGGVYTALGDGEYGGGIASQWAPLHIDIKARTRLMFGPALVTASTQEATRLLLEASLSTKVINGTAVQTAFNNFWATKWLAGNLDVSEMQLFLGAGPRVDAPATSFNSVIKACGFSAGLLGLRWGK